MTYAIEISLRMENRKKNQQERAKTGYINCKTPVKMLVKQKFAVMRRPIMRNLKGIRGPLRKFLSKSSSGQLDFCLGKPWESKNVLVLLLHFA